MSATQRFILYFAAFLLGLGGVHWAYHQSQEMQTAIAMELVDYGLVEAGKGE